MSLYQFGGNYYSLNGVGSYIRGGVVSPPLTGVVSRIRVYSTSLMGWGNVARLEVCSLTNDFNAVGSWSVVPGGLIAPATWGWSEIAVNYTNVWVRTRGLSPDTGIYVYNVAYIEIR